MRLAVFLALFWPLAAWAQQARLDPGALGAQDTRFLQAALVWSGDYLGLTDGAWGERSAAALTSWHARGGDLAPLLQAFADEVAASDWRTLNLDGPLTVALPMALLEPGPEEPNEVELRSADDGLVFRILFNHPAEAMEMHRWMADAHAGPEAPYFSHRDDRLVSAVTLDNGKRVYLRSFLVEGAALSMQVVNRPQERARADLVASSMQWGTAPDLWPAPGSAVERVVLSGTLAATPEPPVVAFAAPAPEDAPDVARPASAPIATGTGFYVNNTDVVTAAHVVEGCRELRLEDGSRLSILGVDEALDVAVLAGERRSEHWLPIGPATGPRLGEPVFALGFPYRSEAFMANQGLAVTGGNVSALPRVADAAARVMISAPVQPGNSGGPLLSGNGVVLGVVVARLDDFYALESTGTLPQNMNFATSVQSLVPFLTAARVLFPTAPAPSQDLSGGIPDSVQAAVVLIGCH